MLSEYDVTADSEPLCELCEQALEEWVFDGLCPDCVVTGLNYNAPKGWEYLHMGENHFDLVKKYENNQQGE